MTMYVYAVAESQDSSGIDLPAGIDGAPVEPAAAGGLVAVAAEVAERRVRVIPRHRSEVDTGGGHPLTDGPAWMMGRGR